MRFGKRFAAIIAAVLLFGAGVVATGPSSLAQDGTPVAAGGHPVHIHSGTCATLGDVIQPLTDVTAPAGDAVGVPTAIVAETSFTTVPMALTDILAAEHAINVHLSNEEIGTYIACGDLGGVLNDTGSLVIGLAELNGSGDSGIAFLTPNAADATQTDVSILLAEGLAGEA